VVPLKLCCMVHLCCANCGCSSASMCFETFTFTPLVSFTFDYTVWSVMRRECKNFKVVKINFWRDDKSTAKNKENFINYLEVPDYILDYATTLKHEDAEDNWSLVNNHRRMTEISVAIYFQFAFGWDARHKIAIKLNFLFSPSWQEKNNIFYQSSSLQLCGKKDLLSECFSKGPVETDNFYVFFIIELNMNISVSSI
jgi:hypothetical protein